MIEMRLIDGYVELWDEGQRYEGLAPEEARHRPEFDEVTSFGDLRPQLLPRYTDVELRFGREWMTMREAEHVGIIWKAGSRPPILRSHNLTEAQIEELKRRWEGAGHERVHTSTLSDMTPDHDGESTADRIARIAALALAEEDETKAIVEWMRKQTWSEFFQDLVKWYDSHGDLTPKQLAAAKSGKAKTEASWAAKAKPPVAPAPKHRTARRKAKEEPEEAPTNTAPNPKWSATPGFYRFPETGDVYKVIIDQHHVHSAYRIDIPEEFGVSGAWQTNTGMYNVLNMGMRMSVDNIAAFGMLYGICLQCAGALVTSEDEERGVHGQCEVLLYEGYGYER